jgi:hypothetical protein
MPELAASGTELVLTRDSIPGLEPAAALVADRWGEIHFAAGSTSAADLPDPTELIEWVRYVQQRCPECEGESR